MFQLILDVEEHKVTAKEHNSNNISDSLEVTIYKKKTKKSISYTVKKARFTKAIAIIVEKRKIEDTIYSFEEVEAPSDAKSVDGGSVQPKDAAGASWIKQGRDFIGSRFGV